MTVEYDKVAYLTFFLQSTRGAQPYTDYTLSADASEIIAWNSALGEKPSREELTNGFLSSVKRDLVSQINIMAGDVRASYLSDGAYIVEEYKLAETEAREYTDRGYADPVPACVKDYADLFPVVDYPATAAGILREAEQLKQLLTIVRKIRLTCTVHLDAAKSLEEANAIFEGSANYLAALKNTRK